MRIGKKGLNPTIPVCHYCGEPKNMIMLTGLEGEKWAKENGHSDGECRCMFMWRTTSSPVMSSHELL